MSVALPAAPGLRARLNLTLPSERSARGLYASVSRRTLRPLIVVLTQSPLSSSRTMARLGLLFALATCALALLAPTHTTRTATRRYQGAPDVPDADPAGSFRYDNSDSISPLEKKQALMNTANWCLERCIKLGHCEVRHVER